MALVHRVLFTWLMTLFFLILLVLRLDGGTIWNWFIIFVPLWAFDAIILAMLAIRMIRHCRNGYDSDDVTMKKKLWYLLVMMLKLGFQMTLCLKLQYFRTIPFYLAFLPLWGFLLCVAGDIFRSFLLRLRND
ncbi:PREDICTED: transmembrane protein 60-like [Branchiostoma belcheri]|uniref:Transmembrane protein 60-like n=1 Tax=Branchiostoma belcheri TaxID=7741 RepID=A0A6P5A2R2_BRABE|nr:PREDICTED: transmembrane protein 60-like [Branchiostoma belcheri]KAI8495367.1 Transmembrane protein 60 [Branchiostoma belcheri]